MITSSPSPTLHSNSYRSGSRYVSQRYSTPSARTASITLTNSSPVGVGVGTGATGRSDATNAVVPDPSDPSTDSPRKPTADASTQWSPQGLEHAVQSPICGKRKDRPSSPSVPPPPEPEAEAYTPGRHMQTSSSAPTSFAASMPSSFSQTSSPKRARPDHSPTVKMMPSKYEDCDVKDLVQLIAGMLMELVRFNDPIPLQDGRLTRFHSRAPPGISVLDYLQRLTTHATLTPPILLSMVYYIDRLCALYPAFTISSLTVHRFLIASATVASKGLSDSFWTNNTYARVGGVSVKELALLELEFLWRVEWRIVPRPEVLVDYYKSLVQRSEGFEVEST